MSLLALLYHSTIPAYRDEGHFDDRLAFQRFGVTDQAARDACLRVDIAGFRLRKGETGDAIKTEMSAACTQLFDRLAVELVQTVSKPITEPVPPTDARDTLLAAVYQLFSSTAYRRNTTATKLPPSTLPSSLHAAWNGVRDALDNGSPGSQVQQELAALCNQLASEFSDPVWDFVW